MKHFLLHHWGELLLAGILLLLIFLNIRPGFLILGNDNFSPELNPALTLERSLFSPAWRTYRVLGLPSDSEQADLFRTSIFYVLERVVPMWVVSQGYVLFTLFLASFSMGKLVGLLTKKLFSGRFEQQAILLGGLFYLSNLLTSWIYFFPVHLFVAAYAFLPFVLWRLVAYFQKPQIRNVLFLLIASLLLATCALTATMFFVCAIVIALFITVCVLLHGVRRWTLLLASGAFVLTIGVQSFWMLPFVTYFFSNAQPLRDSSINRDITATTIENEARFNTALNVPRYFTSWMDTKEDNTTYTFPFRDWYMGSRMAGFLSFVPVVFALFGGLILLKRKQFRLVLLILSALGGWYLIKGINPPLGGIFGAFQEQYPLLAQVFRWQSSKLWPLLATTLPFLGTVGVLSLLSFLRGDRRNDENETYSLVSFRSILSTLLLCIISASLLGFVYPYFQGQLIRDRVYVKVPGEYFALAKYLDDTDSTSRIYLAPEANSLYFRNYSWGFWGSVVLNYLLPNPIVEKALIIGSYENEQAFTVLTNAYYSENPAIFATALRRYDTSYILLDEYAIKGDVGYVYNPEVAKRVIVQNPLLSRVWQQGKLSLYKVKTPAAVAVSEAVHPETDFTRLNTLITQRGQTPSYYAAQGQQGDIYPFALPFSSISFVDGEVLATTKPLKKSGSYTLEVSKTALDEAPTQIIYDPVGSQVEFFPLMPYLTVGEKTILYAFPQKTLRSPVVPRFVTVGETVIDMRDTESLHPMDVLYKDVASSAAVAVWSGRVSTMNLAGPSSLFCNDKPFTGSTTLIAGVKTRCGTANLPLQKDTIGVLSVKLTSADPISGILCVDSSYRRRCVNKNTAISLQGPSTLTDLVLPVYLQTGDEMQLFFEFTSAKKDTTLSIEAVTLQLFDDKTPLSLTSEVVAPEKQQFPVSVQEGDTIALHTPVLAGPNTWKLTLNKIFLPELSVVPFDSSERSMGSISVRSDGALLFHNTNSNSSIFPKAYLLDPKNTLPGEQTGIGMVAMKGEHTSGIPLEVSVRDIDQQYRLWDRKLLYKGKTESLDLFLLPQAVRSYFLEAFATGIGPRPSENAIEGLVFQIIPPSWYTMVLRSTERPIFPEAVLLKQPGAKDTATYTGMVTRGALAMLPTAFSPNWRLEVEGNPETTTVMVDGWRQGWIAGNGGSAKAAFWPNALVYIGFFPLLGVLGWLIFNGVRGVIRHK